MKIKGLNQVDQKWGPVPPPARPLTVTTRKREAKQHGDQTFLVMRIETTFTWRRRNDTPSGKTMKQEAEKKHISNTIATIAWAACATTNDNRLHQFMGDENCPHHKLAARRWWSCYHHLQSSKSPLVRLGNSRQKKKKKTNGRAVWGGGPESAMKHRTRR